MAEVAENIPSVSEEIIQDDNSTIINESNDAANVVSPTVGREIHGFVCPPDSILVEVFFDEGPLGVTLHRRQDGVVIVFQIVDGSQAVNMDIADGDELWAVADRKIEETPLDKAAWQDVVDYIRRSERPLRIVFRRRFAERDATEQCEVTSDRASAEPDSDYEDENSIEDSEDEVVIPGTQLYTHAADASNTARSPSQQSNSTASEIPSSPPAATSSKQPSVDKVEVDRNSIVSDRSSLGGEENEELQLRELMAIASTLVLKEKEKPRASGLAGLIGLRATPDKPVQTPQEFLVVPGRKLIKSGGLCIDCKPGLWSSQPQRHLYLFNDILLICVPTNASFQVETVVELKACKIANGSVYGLLFDSPADLASRSTSGPFSREYIEQVFVLISPAGVVRIATKSIEEKKAWFKDIIKAITRTMTKDERIFGWKHQIVVGTLHSVVLSRDEYKVRELINAMENGLVESSNLDEVDEDGYGALHYAAILRMHGIIRALIEHSADATLADRHGLTPLHWVAMQLDDIGLSYLTPGLFSADIPDATGRSPLYLAVVEGRDSTGTANPESLKKCISQLLALHADANERNTRGGMTLLLYLVSAWQTIAMEEILQAGADIHERAPGERGASAIHYVMDAKSLRRQTTLGTVLRSGKHQGRVRRGSKQGYVGAEVNVDYLSPSDSVNQGRQSSLSGETEIENPPEALIYANGTVTLKILLQRGARPNSKEASGRTPLHILAERDVTWGVYAKEALLMLIEAGARWDDSVQCALLKSKYNTPVETSSGVKGMIDDALDRRAQRAPLNGEMLEITLNGWEGTEASKICYPMDGKDKCVMCSTGFTLFRRQHHCRLCACLCCDDCSKRRIVLQGTQQRVCDSCYNIASARLASLSERVGSRQQSPLTHSQSADARQQRDKLMAGASAANAGSRSSGDLSGLAGVQNSMSEAHEKLMERGEKLSRLTDKSAETAQAADEFARMAKQLNESQRRSWF